MESRAVKLAKKIFLILKDEEYEDSVSALKIAKIMVPTPAARRKASKAQQQKQDEVATEGMLVPADEDLLRFSKAMGSVVMAEVKTDDEPELQ